jgi:hypothetical protein
VPETIGLSRCVHGFFSLSEFWEDALVARPTVAAVVEVINGLRSIFWFTSFVVRNMRNGSAIHTEGRAGNAGGNRTAHKGYEAGNFVSCLKSLDQGTGAHRLEKLLLKCLERLVAGQLRDGRIAFTVTPVPAQDSARPRETAN